VKLIIENYPPITQRSEIDLSKKFTIFVGENNAGKTYVSNLIYELYKNIYENYFELDITHDLVNINFLAKELEEIIENKNQNMEIDLTKNSKLSKYFIDSIQKIIDSIIQQKFFYKNSSISIKFDKNDFLNTKFSSHSEDYSHKFSVIKKNKSLNLKIAKKEKFNENDREGFESWLIESFYYQTIDNVISKYFHTNTVFLPSTRTFFPQFYKYIYRLEKESKDDLIKQIKLGNRIDIDIFNSSYESSVDDIIKKMTLEVEKPRNSNYLEPLERIIEGKIEVKKAESFAMATLKYVTKDGLELEMYKSSSMSNQLSLLYLYFKYWVKNENNFLMIDEPEINLHPQKNIELLELLLKFSSENNNRVLLTTHSPVMAEALINYILMFNLKEQGKNINEILKDSDIEIDSNIELTKDDIGIYYFDGNSIISYEADTFGLHFGTFTKVKRDINRAKSLFLEHLDD